MEVPAGVSFFLVDVSCSPPRGARRQVALPFFGCAFYIGFPFPMLGPYQPENGVWESSLFLQIDPNLISGMQLGWQSIVWPAPGPVGFDVRNGAITTPGSARFDCEGPRRNADRTIAALVAIHRKRTARPRAARAAWATGGTIQR